MVQFEAGAGLGRGYLAVPADVESGVLVLHAWWGLNDFIKSLCDRLAREGFLALAPDLHNGAVATTVKDAKELMSRVEGDSKKSIVIGAVDYLRSYPLIAGRKIGAVGFSMGGAWALFLGAENPDDIAAVVVFYGTGPADFFKTRASFLGHYAPDDEWEPVDEVRALERKIREAGREVTFHFYPGANHWFFEENRPDDYNPEAASLAWNRTLEFLNAKLSQ
jgi:carboxymethylenebutenolidase